MKHFLLAFSMLPLFVFGQNEAQLNKNEFGINMFSIAGFDMYKDPLDKRISTADFNLLPGIFYRHQFEKNAFRAAIDISQKSVYRSDGTDDPYYYSYLLAGTKQNIGISAGLEHLFGKKKLQSYIFSDVYFNYSHFSGIRSEYGCFGPIGIFHFNEEVFEYGLQGGAGLRYSINEHLHLTCEFSLRGFTSVYQDIQHSSDKYVDFGYHLNPVNKLGISVSF
ncbi:hypothetical protein BH09BAC5_BH09BAC5_17550 [soil metagenome]